MLIDTMFWHDLTEDERRIRDLALAVAQEEIAPRAEAHDLNGTFVRDSLMALGEAGLLGVNVPQAYGGLGGSRLATAMAVEAVSAACGSTGAAYFLHLVTTSLIAGAGPEALRQKYLPGLVGTKIGALAMNEGNMTLIDPSGTTLQDRGDHVVADGVKPFVTAAGEADVYVLHGQHAESWLPPPFAVLEQEFLCVDADTPGVSTAAIFDPMGLRGSSNGTMTFTNVKIPKENVIGEAPFSFLRALPIKDESVIGPNLMSLGIAGAALEAAIDKGRQKMQIEWIRHLISTMSDRLNAMRAYNYHAARLHSDDFTLWVRINHEIRRLAGDDAPWICDRAMEIIGGSAYMRASPLQRYYRDARGTAYLMFPMHRRRNVPAFMLYAGDIVRSYSGPTTMPWEEAAAFTQGLLASRLVQMFLGPPPLPHFSRPAIEAAVRARGEVEVTLTSLMEYVYRSLAEMLPLPAPPMGAPGTPPVGAPA